MKRIRWCEVCRLHGDRVKAVGTLEITGQHDRSLLLCGPHRKAILTGKIDVEGRPRQKVG